MSVAVTYQLNQNNLKALGLLAKADKPVQEAFNQLAKAASVDAKIQNGQLYLRGHRVNLEKGTVTFDGDFHKGEDFEKEATKANTLATTVLLAAKMGAQIQNVQVAGKQIALNAIYNRT